MCGIVGYVGKRNAVEMIIEGLKRLEYRGYDSAGIAVIENNKIERLRDVGKIDRLADSVRKKTFKGQIGIGHTRWATHGKPSEENAHPHISCKNDIVLVHNGIIENYIELKAMLTAEGHMFNSETDTESIVHTVEKNFKNGFLEAVLRTTQELKGAYAICVISTAEPDRVIAARKDAPLIVGIGENENFVASDIPAILPYTKKVIYLEDGDVADITAGDVKIYNRGQAIERKTHIITWNAVQAERNGYRHFMLKEIFEQPQAMQDTFRGRLDPEKAEINIDEELNTTKTAVQNISKIYIVACGTSYHAGLLGKYLFENIAKIPCEVDIASEFRYRNPILEPQTVVILITQSGETADTLASLRLAKENGAQTIAICNAVGSTASRDASAVLYTHCGPEIGVASTKAFTGQLTAMYLISIDWAAKKDLLSVDERKRMIRELWEAPMKVAQALKSADDVLKIAKKYFHSSNFMFLGRNYNYPIALEGALKLKEISYIHAEGYAAGEMKHGPIALIDENMPVLVIATASSVYDKIISNIEEVRARQGAVIAVVNKDDKNVSAKSESQIFVPVADELISPIINVVPLQLFAYHCAVLRGNDVDQPRNLAKSVTVE